MDAQLADQPKPKNPGLAAAVQKAGSPTALAKGIGRRQPTVWEWLNVTGKVSAEDAIAIEREYGTPAESINPVLAEFARMRGLRIRKAA